MNDAANMAAWTEAERLATLRDYRILDTPREPAFDDIAELAAQACGTRIALISLVDAGRLWFKAETGSELGERSRHGSICGIAIYEQDLFVATDTRQNSRLADGLSFVSEPDLRFYAGAQLIAHNGLPLGMLCVLDDEPRPRGLTKAQAFALGALARQAMAQMELRRAARQRDEALRAADARLQLALDAGGVIGCWSWDVRADRVTVDQRLAVLFGLTARQAEEGVHNRIFGGTVHPQDLRNFVRQRNIALREGGPFRQEYRLVAAGRSCWVEGSGRVDLGPDGTAIRAAGVLIDITARKQADAERESLLAELDAERFRLQALLDHLPVGVMFAEAPSGRLTLANPQVARITREAVRPTPDIGAHADWAMFHADGTPLRADEYPLTRAILRGETTGAEEYRYRRGDGTETWVELSGAPIRGRGKQVIGGVVAMVDIGDKKLAEQALRGMNETLEARVAERTAQLAASEARFRALIENAPDMIFLARLDPDGEVVFELANPAVSAFLGRPLAELAGQNLSALVDPAAWTFLRERFRQCVASGQIVRFELDMEIAGEPRVVDSILVPMPAPPEAAGEAEAGRLVLSSARDITAQRNTEEALRQAQKMEAVGQLTGGLAHDFNNLLAGIVGSLDLMRRRIEQGRASETGRYIDAALGSADRAAALTHRLLAFSRRQTLDPKPTDVAGLTRAMEELIGRSMGPSITVETAMAEGLWTTLCDRNQLESALLNLAINARDAMPDGGKLSIQGVNLTLDALAAARAGGMAPGPYVAITVSDTGSGMPPDVLARVFEPFFTTKPLGQGTGLGLSMVYGFARQSGGHVRVESTPGVGTQVRLYLPRHEGGAATEAAQAGSAVALAPPGATTVLVVDDEPVVRLLVVEVLEDLGYGAIQAEDGSEGLRILGTNAQIDLLVTDVGLPGGINGRQLADAARVLRPELKVLFITGYAETAALGNGPLGPGLGVLTKPFALDSLAARIRTMIAP